MAISCIKLVLLDESHINPSPYHAGPEANELEKTETYKMLGKSVIWIVESEWASSIVFARMNDSWLRFRIEYRNFTSMIIKLVYQYRK